MKKVVAFALSLAIILSLNAVAFAVDETGVGAGSYSNEVTGSYIAGTSGNGTVFSVDITWTAMSFTYYAEKAPVWNAEDHTYSESAEAYWEGEGTITVTNHSNVKITATPSYTPVEAYNTANMSFSATKLKIASAESGSEQTGTITVTPTGYLPEMEASATIGSITVTIAQDNDITDEETQALIQDLTTLATQLEAAGLTEDSGSLRSKTTAFEYDWQDAEDQEEKNQLYADALTMYNEYAAKLDN